MRDRKRIVAFVPVVVGQAAACRDAHARSAGRLRHQSSGPRALRGRSHEDARPQVREEDRSRDPGSGCPARCVRSAYRAPRVRQSGSRESGCKVAIGDARSAYVAEPLHDARPSRFAGRKDVRAEGGKAGVDGEFLIESVEHTFASRGWIAVVTSNGGTNGKVKVGHGKKLDEKIDLVIPRPE